MQGAFLQAADNKYGFNSSPDVWKVSLAKTYDNPVREECLRNNHIRIGWDEYGPVVNDETDYSLGGKAVLNSFIHKMRIGDIVLSCYTSKIIDAIGVITGDYEWDDSYDEYKRLRKVNWIVKGIRENIVEVNGGSALTLSTVYQMKLTQADVLKIINKVESGEASYNTSAPLAVETEDAQEEEHEELSSENLLDSMAFTSAEGKINVPIGRRESGEIIVRDLDSIPHILVCGFTGTGKTAFVQTMLAVICKTTSPNDIKLVIYDSKGVEYIPFRNSAHLLLPVIKEKNKAISVIEYIAKESQGRFTKFAEAGCKDLDSYNHMVGEAGKLPTIIMIIDDFAMLELDRDEMYQFLTIVKNGRIAGIHLIVVSSISATKVLQKELISNIPCRISFKVTSKAESRTVLEAHGAETLSVPGEMIYKFQNDFIKCQCAYATYENIGNALMANYKPVASISELGAVAASVFSKPERTESKAMEPNSDFLPDELLIEAGRHVTISGKASIGHLQRILRIGFNRAARLMDMLESYGVVGPETGTLAREILMTPSEWEKYCMEHFTNGKSLPPISTPASSLSEKKLYTSSEILDGKADEEPEVALRSFAEFDVQGTSLSISNNKINYSKPIMTRMGQGTLNASFSSCNIKRIIYRKPSYFKKGFFTFEFNPGTGIKNANPGLLYADHNNVSEVIKVEFGFAEDETIKLFLQQISEDIGMPISKV